MSTSSASIPPHLREASVLFDKELALSMEVKKGVMNQLHRLKLEEKILRQKIAQLESQQSFMNQSVLLQQPPVAMHSTSTPLEYSQFVG